MAGWCPRLEARLAQGPETLGRPRAGDHAKGRGRGARCLSAVGGVADRMIADGFLADHALCWQELLRDLIRIRSVFEHEHAVVERVAGYIEALGLPVARIAHTRQRLGALP